MATYRDLAANGWMDGILLEPVIPSSTPAIFDAADVAASDGTADSSGYSPTEAALKAAAEKWGEPDYVSTDRTDGASRSSADRSAEIVTATDWAGVVGDLKESTATMTAGSPIITIPDALFTEDDVGKAIWVHGAGALASNAQTALITTILSVESSTSATLAANATRAVPAVMTWNGKSTSLYYADSNTSGATSTLELRGSNEVFDATDVGDAITIGGAGVAGADLVSTITSVTSLTEAEIDGDFTTDIHGTADVVWGTDSADGLMNMRAALVAIDPTRHWHIKFPPGNYAYSNNRWLAGLRKFTVSGEGATLRCSVVSSSTIDKQPFYIGDPWSDCDPDGAGQASYDAGYRFDTVAVGVQQIQCTTIADALNVTVGDRVLLGSRDQQHSGGYPPNLRYFEWNTITAVDTVNGTLALKTPTQHNYSSDWCDTDSGSVLTGANPIRGKPRFMLLDRPLYTYPEYVELRDIKLALNPSYKWPANAYYLQIPAEVCIFRNLTHPGNVSSSMCRHFEIEDGDYTTFSDMDKILDYCILRRAKCGNSGSTTYRAISSCTGINHLIVEECQLGGVVSINARNASFRRNTLLVPEAATATAIPFQHGESPNTEIYEVVDNTVVAKRALPYLINDLGVTGGSNTTQFTVASAGSGNAMVLTDTAVNRAIINKLAIGTMVYTATYSDYGSITGISYNGTAWEIRGNWRAVIAGTEVYIFHQIAHWKASGNKVVGQPRVPTFRLGRIPTLFSPENGHGSVGALQRVAFNFRPQIATLTTTWSIQAFIDRIKITVLAPYSGVDAAPRCNVRIHDGVTGNQERIIFSPATRGWAETTVNGTSRSGLTTTALTMLTDGQIVRDFFIQHGATGVVWTDTDPAVMPVFHVELDVRPILTTSIGE